MNCPDPVCRIVQCQVTDDLPSYFGQYSLQNGTFYTNLAITVPSPGGGSYTLPPGEIVIVVPPGAKSVSYQGCLSTVTSELVAGQEQSIVSALMLQIAQQAAICNSVSITPVGGLYWNERISVACADPLLIKVVGTFPPGVTADFFGIFVQAGMFSSRVSTTDANNRAEAFAYTLLNPAHVLCGYWNEEQTFVCPDTTVQTVPGFTYFSQVSQADANSLALAAAQAACPEEIIWEDMLWDAAGSNIGPGGSASFSPQSTTGGVAVTLTTISPNSFPDSDWAFISNTGTIDYVGGPFNCNLHIELSFDVGDPNVPASVDMALYMTVIVYDGITPVDVPFNPGNVIPTPTASGSWSLDFPITIPDSGGLTYTVELYVNNHLSWNLQSSPLPASIDVTNISITNV